MSSSEYANPLVIDLDYRRPIGLVYGVVYASGILAVVFSGAPIWITVPFVIALVCTYLHLYKTCLACEAIDSITTITWKQEDSILVGFRNSEERVVSLIGIPFLVPWCVAMRLQGENWHQDLAIFRGMTPDEKFRRLRVRSLLWRACNE